MDGDFHPDFLVLIFLLEYSEIVSTEFSRLFIEFHDLLRMQRGRRMEYIKKKEC